MDTLIRDTLEFLPALLAGAGESAKITLVSLALALSLGLALALARMSHKPVLHWPSYCFIEFIRNTPAILQIYYVFFVFPYAGVTLPRFWAGVLALGINFSAYLAEVYRGGIESIGTGQWDAAKAIGMSNVTTMRRIVLPQALRKILPPVANYALSLFKVTSLLSLSPSRNSPGKVIILPQFPSNTH